MRADRLKTLPSMLLMTAFAGATFSYADLYVSDFQLIALPTTAAYIFIALLALAAAGVVVRCTLSARVRREVVGLYAAHAPVILALAAIVFFSTASALLPDAYWDEGPRYVLFPIYDAAVVVLSMALVYPPAHRARLRSYLLAGFLVLAASVLLDAVRPGTFSPWPDRATGFAENPNTAAFVLVALCCAILRFDRARPGDVPLLLLTSACVLVTLSRGGGVMLAFMVVCYAFAALDLRRLSPAKMIGGVAALAALVALVYGAAVFLLERASLFDVPSQTRVAEFFGKGEFVPSDEPRTRVLLSSFRLALDRPLLGYGTGYTYRLPVGPHNIYLQQWLNSGAAGLVAYLALLVAAGRAFWARRCRPGLVFLGLVVLEGLFSHNLLEERIFLVLLGTLLTQSYFARRTRGAEVGPIPAATRARPIAPPRRRSAPAATRRPEVPI